MHRWQTLFNKRARQRQLAFFQALTECTESIQHHTAATVAVVQRGASGSYLDGAFLIGSFVSWVGLLLILFLPHEIHPYLVLVDVILLFVAGSYFGARMRLRAWLTDRRRQRHQVKTAAHAAFFEEGIHHAPHENGVLVYWSHLERRVEVVAGAGVLTAVPMKEYHAVLHALRRAAKDSKDDTAFLVPLRQLGDLLAHHLPLDEHTTHARMRLGRTER